MKKSLLSILSLFLVLTSSAQEIVVGDMNGDGKVTVGDITEVVNTVNGKTAVRTISGKTLVDPYASDTESLVGTWRSIAGERITLGTDATASHSSLQAVKTY